MKWKGQSMQRFLLQIVQPISAHSNHVLVQVDHSIALRFTDNAECLLGLICKQAIFDHHGQVKNASNSIVQNLQSIF